MVRREKYDFLLAVGGGSAIDTAKAIALGVPYDGDFWDFYAGKAEAKEAMPVGVVLTIPAAGSEASGNTVITNVATGQKFPCAAHSCCARVFCAESRTHFHVAAFPNSLRHLRHDGAHL